MGKLVKGLIAAAIPVAVIVGIASCGQRPVVMTSAASTTTNNYTFRWTLTEAQENEISNTLYNTTGYNFLKASIGTTASSVWSFRNNLVFLESFDYSVTTDGEITISNNFVWRYWSASNESTNYGNQIKAVLAEKHDYFFYAYASGSDGSLVEWGFPSLRRYNISTGEVVNTNAVSSDTQGTRFYAFNAPSTGYDYKINVTYLKEHLKTMIHAWLMQDAAPLIDNQPIFDQGREQGYQAGYEAGFSDGKTDGYDDGFWDGRNQGYREGQNSVTSESTAINNLFASLVSVPINVLNGLMPMAVWNSPIVGIMITFMLLAMLMWLIRKLLSR